MKTKTTFTLLIFLPLLFSLLSLPAQAHEIPYRPIVRLIYFVPSDEGINRGSTPIIGQGYEERIRNLMRKTQSLYEQEMKRHGFEDANGKGKTFWLEIDQDEAIVVHKIDGKLSMSEYQGDSQGKKNSRKIDQELFFDDDAPFRGAKKDIYLIFVQTDELFEGSIHGLGIALHHNTNNTDYTLQVPFGLFGIAKVPYNKESIQDDVFYKYNTPIQHELGHAFGLLHDYRNDKYVMSYGHGNQLTGGLLGTKLSKCAAEWLNHHRAFNQNQDVLNSNTTFFKNGTQVGVGDPDGIGSVQIIKHDVQRVSDESLVGCQSSRLAGNVGILFDPTTFSATIKRRQVEIKLADKVTLQAIDGYGNITRLQNFTLENLPDASLSASVVSPLTEATLHGTTISLLLTHATYDQDIAKIRDAVTVSGIDGVTINSSKIQRLSDTEVTVELGFDGTDFVQHSALIFSVDAGAIKNYKGTTLTAEIPVTASRDESLMKIYWTAGVEGKVQRATLNGAFVKDLVTRLRDPQGIALDVVGGKMYWTDYSASALGGRGDIQRANLDGSNVEDLVTGLGSPQGIALDVVGGKMYWIDDHTSKIQRANLDGSDVEDIVTGLGDPQGIALDVLGGKMYWTNHTGKIQRANLDGSDVEDIVTGLSGVYDIALDVVGSKMYWTNSFWTVTGKISLMGKIQRANLDGSDVEDIVTQGLGSPQGIALDVLGGKMYWTDSYTDKIQCANLDGSNVEDLVTRDTHGLLNPYGIAIGMITPVNPTTGKEDVNRDGIVWTDDYDSYTGKIQRANLDGSDVEDLVTQRHAGPHGIALDVVDGKMYWTDNHTGKIQRANLDGSDVENFGAQGLGVPHGIALDVVDGKMYWTDNHTGKIQRANLDGSDVEDIVTFHELTYLRGIALDVGGGKMYWTEFFKIQRANLDGSDVEDLVTFRHGLKIPQGIALDVGSGKMYWTDSSRRKIQRANLDGSDMEDLVTGLGDPHGIALDVGSGKMYWTDSSRGKIQRANLDGSDVEDIVTGLLNPYGIAIGITPVNPTTAKKDVNGDGVVDVQDLVSVAQEYGKTGTNAADVNGDGVVNVDDFILVAAAVDSAAAAAPDARAQVQSHFTASQLQGWLTEAHASGNSSGTYQRGIAVLEQLLTLFKPEETALLANFPNPFNPETWIPYQLATPADVSITIYAADGKLVRKLDLGHQRTGIYQSRKRAAHWDGKNDIGESVASGVYFYTLKAGDFSATRKMLILK